MTIDPSDNELLPNPHATHPVVADAVKSAFPLGNLIQSRSFFNPARGLLKRQLKDAIGKAPNEPLDMLDAIIAQSDLSAYDFRRRSQRWGRFYYVFGFPAVVLATFAGATGLAWTTGRIPAAVVALLSACFGAAATFLKSEQNRKKSDDLSAAWQELGDDARLQLLQSVASLKGKDRSTFVATSGFWQVALLLLKRKAFLLRGDLSTPPAHPADSLTKMVDETRTHVVCPHGSAGSASGVSAKTDMRSTRKTPTPQDDAVNTQSDANATVEVSGDSND